MGTGLEWAARTATALLVASTFGCHHAPLSPARDGGAGTIGAAGLGVGAGTIASGEAGVTGSPSPIGGDPGTVGARRLTNFEYDHTIYDLLGIDGHARETFEPDERADLFEGFAEAQMNNDARVEQYFNTADALATMALADPAARARLLTCVPTGTDACLRSIVVSLAARAWRRPLTTDEEDDLFALARAALADGDGIDDALHLVVTALLSSAPFLYRFEFDDVPTSTAPHPLAPYELASRLSYWLWSTMPDERLFARAADGTLLRDDVLRAEVNRMLDDPRGEAFVESFGDQWLGGRELLGHQVEPTAYPEFDEPLRQAMLGELRAYISEFVRGGRSFATFLDADVNFVNARLARHYALATTGLGDTLQRVENTADRRKGYLGLGGILTLTSSSYRTFPTLRGYWILERLLCTPADGDPNPQMPEPTTSLGRPLEDFDAVGAFRAQNADGTPVDSSGALPDGTKVVGELQLADALAREPRFLPCSLNRALTYALGRELGASDAPFLARLGDAWSARGLTFRALLEEIALDATFRTRHGESP